MTVATLVEEHLMSSGQRAFPVVEDDRFVGLVTLADLNKIDRGQWPHTRLEQVMTPARELVTASPEQDAVEALDLVGRRDLDQLPVVADGELRGLLRRKDIVKWLALHGAAPDGSSESGG